MTFSTTTHHPVLLFFVFSAWVAVYILYGVVKYGSFSASQFGAPIERTVGRFTMGDGTQVEVHQLGGKSPEKAIGIVFKQFGIPVLLFATSISESQKLVALVTHVVGGNGTQETGR